MEFQNIWKQYGEVKGEMLVYLRGVMVVLIEPNPFHKSWLK